MYEEDEEYISAKNSRVYHYAGEKQRMYVTLPGYGEVWVDGLEKMPLSEVDPDGLEKRDGRLVYAPGGEVASLCGIDLSHHNGDIDWDKVKADGIDFAFLRVGYRGYESGELNLDKRFHEYAQGASEAGIDIGVYFFSQAVTEEEALEETELLLSEIEGYDIKYPVVLDWET
ncbi:MAG: glycoside hydrolase, partial [Oscillospiraceae bacterium]|nr:glycoside hydrolase [Oscillospiraceae bacterium]